MNYFYLFPSFPQALNAYDEMRWSKFNIVDHVRYSDMSISIGGDYHLFVVVPIDINIQDEKIMGIVGKCDASALFAHVEEAKKLIEFRVQEIEYRLKYEPKGDGEL